MFSSIILFGSFFLFLALGVPIAFVLIVATVSYALLSTGDANLALVPQRIIYGINSFTMLCLPFFALAGNIMNHGGITMRLVRFAQAFVGHIKGGLAMVDILVCMMFGTVSGSAVAGTAAVGCLMIPAMKDEKYDPAFTAGLTACASCCCPIIPPSLAFVIYGAAAKVSVGDMFIAGVVPGILMGLIMMLVVYVFAVKRDFQQVLRQAGRKMGSNQTGTSMYRTSDHRCWRYHGWFLYSDRGSGGSSSLFPDSVGICIPDRWLERALEIDYRQRDRQWYGYADCRRLLSVWMGYLQ